MVTPTHDPCYKKWAFGGVTRFAEEFGAGYLVDETETFENECDDTEAFRPRLNPCLRAWDPGPNDPRIEPCSVAW